MLLSSSYKIETFIYKLGYTLLYCGKPEVITMSNIKIKRIYRQKVVSNMTLSEIERLIDTEGIAYSGDYGLKVMRDVRLVYSLN